MVRASAGTPVAAVWLYSPPWLRTHRPPPSAQVSGAAVCRRTAVAADPAIASCCGFNQPLLRWHSYRCTHPHPLAAAPLHHISPVAVMRCLFLVHRFLSQLHPHALRPSPHNPCRPARPAGVWCCATLAHHTRWGTCTSAAPCAAAAVCARHAWVSRHMQVRVRGHVTCGHPLNGHFVMGLGDVTA